MRTLKTSFSVTDTTEYRAYLRKFRNNIGFNVVAYKVTLCDRNHVNYSLEDLTYDECFDLIVKSLTEGKDYLLERVKDKIVEINYEKESGYLMVKAMQEEHSRL